MLLKLGTLLSSSRIMAFASAAGNAAARSCLASHVSHSSCSDCNVPRVGPITRILRSPRWTGLSRLSTDTSRSGVSRNSLLIGICNPPAQAAQFMSLPDAANLHIHQGHRATRQTACLHLSCQASFNRHTKRLAKGVVPEPADGNRLLLPFSPLLDQFVQ